ncbi:apoptosis antagonizing transcription factor-domain-containing protein [Chiua virens]|nr:apoptosis antagonizing transcription factor-domain-containing protein [Chiua virens]
MQRLSLAQQIAQLEDVAPADLDPEDVEVTGIDPDFDLDISADNNDARAHYVDVGPSSLRQLHESLSGPKYDGAKTSREQIHDEFDDSESDSASKDAESGSYVSEVSETRDFDEGNGVKHELDIADAPAEHPGPKQNNDMSSSLSKIQEDDRKKGRAISRQIALWDSLLDARIRLQKSVAAGNRLPPPQEAPDERVHTALMKMFEEARLLSNEIFEFQERLLSENESIQPPPRKRRKGSETDCSVTDYTDEFREASIAASELECAYHSHLVQTLSKWSSKIQAVAPSVLLPSNRNAFSKTTQHIKTAIQLIDETLVDHNKVLARTRSYRGKGSRLGDADTEEDGDREKEDPEVFD